MRKALHIHMLIQLVGFSHPHDLFGNSVLPDIFRRLWYFVASISFRSTEAFAAYLHEDAAMAALAQQPLLPLTKKQRGMIGEERAQESQRAQLRARGLNEMPAQAALPGEVYYFPSQAHGDGHVTSANWAAQVTEDIAAMTRRAGNHVCRPDVCHKGRLGEKGFCRMFFWHWARHVDRSGALMAKMTHGLALQPRWEGEGSPPLYVGPPFEGLPALEIPTPSTSKCALQSSKGRSATTI